MIWRIDAERNAIPAEDVRVFYASGGDNIFRSKLNPTPAGASKLQNSHKQ